MRRHQPLSDDPSRCCNLCTTTWSPAPVDLRGSYQRCNMAHMTRREPSQLSEMQTRDLDRGPSFCLEDKQKPACFLKLYGERPSPPHPVCVAALLLIRPWPGGGTDVGLTSILASYACSDLPRAMLHAARPAFPSPNTHPTTT